MRRSSARAARPRRVAAALCLAIFLPSATGCFGTFQLTRKVYGWNKSVHRSKWVRWGVFLTLVGLPVYASAMIFDALFANPVEFWSGSNPFALREGESRTVVGRNGEVMRVRREAGDVLDVEVTGPGAETTHLRIVPEDHGMAAYAADGSLLARLTETPDGRLELARAEPLRPASP